MFLWESWERHWTQTKSKGEFSWKLQHSLILVSLDKAQLFIHPIPNETSYPLTPLWHDKRLLSPCWVSNATLIFTCAPCDAAVATVALWTLNAILHRGWNNCIVYIPSYTFLFSKNGLNGDIYHVVLVEPRMMKYTCIMLLVIHNRLLNLSWSSCQLFN